MRVMPFNQEPGCLSPTLAKIPFSRPVRGRDARRAAARLSVLEFPRGDTNREGNRVVKGAEVAARIDGTGARIGEFTFRGKFVTTVRGSFRNRL